jgi:predicted ArsR family transcriptional regulator
LAALRDHPDGADSPQLARRCGVHVTTVRFHLDVLKQAGLVESRTTPSLGPGRPRLLYVLTETTAETTAIGDGVGTDAAGLDVDASEARPRKAAGYEFLARVLAEHFDDDASRRASRAERAGQALADDEILVPATHAPAMPVTLDGAVKVVAARFETLGFAPKIAANDAEVVLPLHACPFESVARMHPQVVCSLHLGLLRGSLQRLRAPVGQLSLEPFTSRGTCVARIERRPADGYADRAITTEPATVTNNRPHIAHAEPGGESGAR